MKQADAKSCGACTLCCRLTAVPELEKPVNVWCGHCDVGRGCRIYDQRPGSCANFKCLWIQRDWEPELRPDRSKVVFEQLNGKETVLALADPGRPSAWRSARVVSVLKRLSDEGLALVVSSGPGRDKHVILPKGKTENDVWTDLGISAPKHRMIGRAR